MSSESASESTDSTPTVYVFGNSHVSCIGRALALDGQPPTSRIQVSNINRHWDRLKSLRIPSLSQLVAELYREELGGGGASLFVSLLGGNEHSVLGMVEEDRPFDFVLPGHEHLPMRSDGERLTFALVREAMQHRTEGAMKHLAPLRALLGEPMIHLEAPPPVADNDYASRVMRGFFKSVRGSACIAPPMVRWKMWKLQCRLAREVAEKCGARYIPNPPEIFDRDGFLAREFWGNDATHGNADYGRLTIRRIDRIARNRELEEARIA